MDRKEDLVKKGEVYTISIVDIGSKGEGIGKLEGMTIFVEGGLTGDQVQGRITKVKSHYAVAELEQILEPSALRTQALCPVAHGCGGCQIMQMRYEEQLKFKENRVKETLRRIGGLQSFEMLPIIGMEEPFRYRNKAQFPVEKTPDGGIVMGFYEKGSHRIVPIEGCPIQHPVNDEIIKVFREFFQKHSVSIYDENTKKGNLRRIITKVGFETGDVMVALVTKERDFPWKKELMENLKKSVPGLKTILQNIHPHPVNAVMGKENILWLGDGFIRDAIGPLTFEIALPSFFQVNPIQTKAIYEKALEFSAVTPSETVIDVYCGAGTISLFLAKKAGKVVGIESVQAAVEDARKNARQNNIGNAEFHLGKAEELLPALYEKGLRPQVAVVDPPRKGCEEAVLHTIARMNPQRIIYVSCNPATLARDAGILQGLGYETVKVQTVDNFPHSVHVETIVLMSATRRSERAG